MFWQEKNTQDVKVTDNVIDLIFKIQCRTLPVDHAYDLFAALRQVVPWIADEPRIGVHAIHVAGSQNGWERPDPELGQLLHLSRRTKLTLRVPRERRDDIEKALTGTTLDIAGNSVAVGDAKSRLLSRQGTVFARYVVLEPGEEDDEHRFMTRAAQELVDLRICVRKALCGKTAAIQTPAGPVPTRSLMLAELSWDESVRLQEEGLGPLRHMGCGIFIPHKGIEAVNNTAQDDN